MQNSHSELRAPIILGLLVLFLGFCIGYVFNLYDKFASFDTLVHFLGGLTVAFFFARFFIEILPSLSVFKKIFFLVASACCIGVLWECAEYTSSILSPINAPFIFKYFHIGSLSDTLMDLVADMLGGLTFAMLTLRQHVRNVLK